MDDNKRFESVYSSKVRAGKRRTYFFDVKETKGGDYYITLTESTKKFNGDGYERHKIFLYKEDFNRFVKGLDDVVNHVKTELMPDYDYEIFEKRQAEWEKMQAEEAKKAAEAGESGESNESVATENASEASSEEGATNDVDSEEDMSW